MQLLQELWADLGVEGGNAAGGGGEGKYSEGNSASLHYVGSSASDDSEYGEDDVSTLQAQAPTATPAAARNKNVFAC